MVKRMVHLRVNLGKWDAVAQIYYKAPDNIIKRPHVTWFVISLGSNETRVILLAFSFVYTNPLSVLEHEALIVD